MMIAEVFLTCALSVPAFISPKRVVTPPITRQEISVIRALGEMSAGQNGKRPLVYFGPDASWVEMLRAEGLPALGLMNHNGIKWPHFTIGLTHLLPFKDASINVLIFMNHFPFFDELDRVIKPGGFLIFDGAQNISLVTACESMRWRWRFSIREYSVYQKRAMGSAA